MPLLSVVTVNRNTGSKALQTLESLASQGFIDFEHIIIDGASQDESLDHIKSYAASNLRYKVKLISEPDEGIYDAMNKGLKLACGDYIFFLNVGDRLESSQSLELWSKEVQKQNLPEFWISAMILDHGQNRYTLRRYPQDFVAEYWIREYLCHQAFFCKTQWLKDIGGFDVKYKIAADFDLFLKARKAGAWHVSETPVAIFAMDGASNAEDRRLSILKDFNRIQKKHLGFVAWFIFKLRAKVEQGADSEPRMLLRFIFRMLRILCGRLFRYEPQASDMTYLSTNGVAPKYLVLHINSHLFSGGAARACYRLHRDLNSNSKEFVSQIAVMKKEFADDFLEYQAPFKLGLSRALFKFRSLWEDYLLRYFYKNTRVALVSQAKAGIVDLPSLLRQRKPDLVHLHWVCAQTLSLEDFEALKSQKVVWTFHDQWPIGGGEHVLSDERYRLGYDQTPMNPWESGIDLNRSIWERKKDAFAVLKDARIVVPSESMAEMARASVLWKSHKIVKIPRGLDFDFWKPLDKKACREAIGLDPDGVYFTYGAMDVLSDPNKGFDLLFQALSQIDVTQFQKTPTLLLVGYYGKNPFEKLKGWNVVQVGLLQSDLFLRQVYSASDLMLVPSRVESFGFMALEAQACGCPVICFDTSGLKDVVEQGRGGYRAQAFDPKDFAQGVLEVYKKQKAYSQTARDSVVAKFTLDKMRMSYESLYREILGNP